MKKSLLFFIAFLAGATCFAQKDTAAPQYIPIVNGFYNLENMFDTVDNPKTIDEEFLPTSAKRYGKEIYTKKLHNLASTLGQIGTDVNPDGLAFFGVVEIESDSALNDLTKQKEFENRNYKYIITHCDDARGINVGLVYSEKYLDVKYIHAYKVDVGYNTRDILYVKGILIDEPVHILVNHWPSRRGSGNGRSYVEDQQYYRSLNISGPGTAAATIGDRAFTGTGAVSDGHGNTVTWNAIGNDDGQGNEQFRYKAAADCRKIVDSIFAIEPNAKIIVMGDLNDNPTNPSVTDAMKAKSDIADTKPGDIYNPYINIYKQGYGTIGWRGHWHLFDQIMFSHALLDQQNSSLFLYKTHIFYRDFLIEQKDERYKGYPRRTWAGDVYADGYSDHLPVYDVLLKRF